MRRSRADWPVVAATWLLLASALSLLAAGALYSEAVTLAGLRSELREAPAADRAIVVATTLLPERLEAADGAITPELEAAIGPTGGAVTRVLRSGPFADPAVDPAAVTNLVLFASYQDVDRHAVLVAGAWPTAGASPVEATLSAGAAGALGLEVGDVLDLADRLSPDRRAAVRITGVWRPDADDPYWLDDPLALVGAHASGTYTTRGPLLVDRADLVGTRLAQRLEAEWRAIPDIDGFRPDNLDAVAAGIDGVAARIRAALPGSNQASVSTRLPAIIAAVDRSVLVTQAGILLLIVQFLVLAGYAVLLVAALLLDRRRAEMALLRSRGAGAGHLVVLAAGEALFVAVPAALAAPWLAALLVAVVRVNPALAGVGLSTPLPGLPVFAIAAAGGLVAVVALTLPTALSGVSISGARAALGRQVGRTLAQRLGLDLALVLLAAIAMWQLRLYGAPLTRNARGALGVDPLLVAAPAIGLLGGAVLATRIVPRVAELGERVLVLGRGLVASLAGRQVARRPLRYTRAALLLILAAALGTFASAHAATWTRSQADQAAFASAADIRMTPAAGSGVPAWAMGEALRAVPGIEAASPVVRQTVDVGQTVRGGPLLAVDGPALARIVAIRPEDGRDAAVAALAALPGDRPPLAAVDVPAGARRIAIRVAGALEWGREVEPLPGDLTPPPDAPALIGSVVVADADGRLWRIPGSPGPPAGETRLVVPLASAANGDAGLRAPVRVVAVEVVISAATGSIVAGSVDLEGLDASPSADGDDWGALPLSLAAPWRWRVDVPGSLPRPYAPPEDRPGRISVASLAGGTSARFRLDAAPLTPAPVHAIASRAFLEATGLRSGERVAVSSFGIRVDLQLAAELSGFPPLDPAIPLVLADNLGMELARFGQTGQVTPVTEWWLGIAPGASAAVERAILAPPIAATRLVARASLQRGLDEDALALGVIGILGLGSVAALVFAAIGFLVSATVSTAERLGEFALLRALGLSPRQLSAWLAVESVSLLVVGLVTGTGLGLLLAWLALPFATLTASGAPPIPPPNVVVPPESLVPTALLAVVLLVATLVLVRRQLPRATTSTVLRARDE